MNSSSSRKGSLVVAVAIGLVLAKPLRAWNAPGHQMINEIAVAALPPDFPAWVRSPATVERIVYLAPEPDRWRDTRNDVLQQYNGLDHYIDFEQIIAAGFNPHRLTPFRYDFIADFVRARTAHPERFRPVDPAHDWDHTRAWAGMLPWAISEYYAKIQVDFSILRVFERYGGTPAEIENTKQDLVYEMGMMGHYVGDGSQPLHTTMHYNGWEGPNPKGYTTAKTFHAWIDGGFIAKAGITEKDLLPRLQIVEPLSLAPRADGRDPVFAAILDYLLEQNAKVEKVYQLEKDHKLEGADPGSAEGREFIEGQLVIGGEMLARLWLTAWRHPTPCHYLQNELTMRQLHSAK